MRQPATYSQTSPAINLPLPQIQNLGSASSAETAAAADEPSHASSSLEIARDERSLASEDVQPPSNNKSTSADIDGTPRGPNSLGHQIETLDLTADDDGHLLPMGHVALSDPVPRAQSSLFPDLPTLEMNDDFDLTTSELGANIDLDQCQPSTLLPVTETSPSDAASRPSVSFPAPARPVVTQTVQSNIPRMSPYLPNDAPSAASLSDMSLPPQSAYFSFAPPPTQPPPADTLPVQHPPRVTTVPQLGPTQLLTPEASPLHRPTPLIRAQRPASSSYASPQIPQQSQARRSQAEHPASTMSQITTRHRPATNGPGLIPAGPAQRPPSQAMSSTSLANKCRSYLATMDSTIQDISQRMNLDTISWKLRQPWLHDACQRGDVFFLHLNQLFCMWTLQQSTLRFLGFDQSSDAGFMVLELLFGKNTELPTELLAFLGGWPNSTYSLGANEQLKQWTPQLSQFMPMFGKKWPGFRQHCLQRAVPPMFNEIIHHLGCPTSIILPRAIFCSLQKQISPNAPAKLQVAVFEMFCDSMTAALAGQPITADYFTFKKAYQNIYAWHTSNSGSTQHRGSVATSIPVQDDHLRSLNQLAFPVQEANRPHTIQASQLSVNGSSAGPPVAPPISRPITTTSARSLFITTTPTLGSNTTPPSVRSQTNLPTDHDPVQQSFRNLTPTQTDFAQLQGHSLPTLTGNTMRSRVNPSSAAATSTLALIPDEREMLLPVDCFRLPDIITNPNPLQEALHQIHLRQPLTELKSSSDGPARLYQYIEAFVLNPSPWSPVSGLIKFPFIFPSELLERRSDIIENDTATFVRPKRIVGDDSVLFNLRCVQTSDRDINQLSSSWASLPTNWPQHIFISINNVHLEIRRKRHNKRDLPIDVTSLVTPGRNEVKVSIHPEPNERSNNYAVAVEVIGFCGRTKAIALPVKVDSKTSLRSITSVMEPQQDAEDDDLVLVDDSMIISITDPFSSRLFNTPVRGKTCKHRECFDLETFLESRESDYKDALTSVYAWQCPICKGDARPCSLIIDGFFQDVRDKIIETGQDEARAIVVKGDGTWTVRQDIEENATASRKLPRQRSRGSEVPPSERANKAMRHDSDGPTNTAEPFAADTNTSLHPATIPQIHEVIELD